MIIRRSTIEKWVVLLCITISWLCSLFEVVWYHRIYYAVYPVVAVMLMISIVLCGHIRYSKIVLLYSLFSGYVFLNVLISGNNLYLIIPTILISLLLLLNPNSNLEIYKLMLYLFIVSAVIVGATIVYQMIFHDSWIQTMHKLYDNNEMTYLLYRSNYEGYYAGMFYDPSIAASVLVTGIAALYAIISRIKLLNAALIILLLIFLFATGKRAQISFVVLSIVIYIIVINTDKKKLVNSLKLIDRVLVLIFIVIAICYTFNVKIGINFNSFRLFNLLNSNASSTDISNGRMMMWIMALSIFENSNMFFGFGWRQFSIFNFSGNDLHNVYLQILCETGLIGFILYMAFIISAFVMTLIIAIKNHNSNYRSLITFSAIYQLYFLFYSFSGNPLYDFSSFLPFILSVVIVLKIKRSCRRRCIS